MTVAGLPAGTYDVYVYADGDNGVFSRTGAYRISGAGITTTTINLTDAGNTNFNATFTQANNSAGNYVKFTITASGLHADGDAGFGHGRDPAGTRQRRCRLCGSDTRTVVFALEPVNNSL